EAEAPARVDRAAGRIVLAMLRAHLRQPVLGWNHLRDRQRDDLAFCGLDPFAPQLGYELPWPLDEARPGKELAQPRGSRDTLDHEHLAPVPLTLERRQTSLEALGGRVRADDDGD